MRITEDANIDKNSKALIKNMASAGRLYLNKEDWSIPVYFIESDITPKHHVMAIKQGIYGKGFGPDNIIPIPDNAVPSPPVDGDNHLAIIDKQKGLEWGMWWARQTPSGEWSAGLGAVTDLVGSGVAPPWNESNSPYASHRARASGFPLIAGLIRPEEVASGRIDHALVFAYPYVRTEYFISPASTAQAQTPQTRDSDNGMPMGARIQLNPLLDITDLNLSPSAQVIARALQEYGAYLGDYAGANVLYLDNSPEALAAWDGVLDSEDLGGVFTADFIAKNFRLINMGQIREGQNIGQPNPSWK